MSLKDLLAEARTTRPRAARLAPLPNTFMFNGAPYILDCIQFNMVEAILNPDTLIPVKLFGPGVFGALEPHDMRHLITPMLQNFLNGTEPDELQFDRAEIHAGEDGLQFALFCRAKSELLVIGDTEAEKYLDNLMSHHSSRVLRFFDVRFEAFGQRYYITDVKLTLQAVREKDKPNRLVAVVETTTAARVDEDGNLVEEQSVTDMLSFTPQFMLEVWSGEERFPTGFREGRWRPALPLSDVPGGFQVVNPRRVRQVANVAQNNLLTIVNYDTFDITL